MNLLTKKGRIIFMLLNPNFNSLAVMKNYVSMTDKQLWDAVQELENEGFVISVRKDRATVYEPGPALVGNEDYKVVEHRILLGSEDGFVD